MFGPSLRLREAVGSEVALRVAPMLATVRRSNRACSFPAHGFHEDSTSRGRKRRNQSDQIYQPKLAIEHRLRQLSPTTVAPAPESMRPDASHDPSVKLVEEFSDVGTLVILAPTSQERVQRFDQLLGRQRCAPLRALPHLILETPDRFLARIGIQPIPRRSMMPFASKTSGTEALRTRGAVPFCPVRRCKREQLTRLRSPRLRPAPVAWT